MQRFEQAVLHISLDISNQLISKLICSPVCMLLTRPDAICMLLTRPDVYVVHRELGGSGEEPVRVLHA